MFNFICFSFLFTIISVYADCNRHGMCYGAVRRTEVATQLCDADPKCMSPGEPVILSRYLLLYFILLKRVIFNVLTNI